MTTPVVTIHYVFDKKWQDQAGRFMNTPKLISDGMDKIGSALLQAAKRYPPESSLTREDVYGQHSVTGELRGRDGIVRTVTMFTSFKTPKQAAWFWANRPEEYWRTNTTMANWEVRKSALKVDVVNTLPYAKYLHGNRAQSQFARKVGWKTVHTILAENTPMCVAIMKLQLGKLGP